MFPLEAIRQEFFDVRKLLHFKADDDGDDLLDSNSDSSGGDGGGGGDVDRHGDRQFAFDVAIRDAWTLEFTLSEDEISDK